MGPQEITQALVPAAGRPSPRRDLSGDLAALSLADLTSQEFFKRLLARIVTRAGAAGGLVWLIRKDESESSVPKFELQSAINRSKSPLPAAEPALASHLESCLMQVFRTNRNLIVYPASSDEAAAREGNFNRSPFGWCFSLLVFRERPLAVVMLAVEPKAVSRELSTRLQFIRDLGQHVSTHLALRRKQEAILRSRSLSNLLDYASGLLGELRKEELAVFVVNGLRDLVGCDRASLYEFNGRKWTTLAISGNDTLDQTSVFVNTIKEVFSSLVQVPDYAVIDTLRSEDPIRTEPAIEKLSSMTNTASVFVVPIKDPQERAVFGIMMESARPGFFEKKGQVKDSPDMSQSVSVSLWACELAGKALLACRQQLRVPFGRTLLRIREAGAGLGERRRFLFVAGIVAPLALCLGFLPWSEKIIGGCALLPTGRAIVVTEVSGRLSEVLVHEGSLVQAGEVLARLDTSALASNLEVARQERLRFEAEVRRFQGAADMGAYRTAYLKEKQALEVENKLRDDIERATLRSPIAGVILTKDVNLKRGEVLPIGQQLCEVASLTDWDLQVEVDEADFGMLEGALETKKEISVDYILHARSNLRLHAELNRPDQLSQMAYPIERGNVFYATVSGIALPKELISDVRPGFSGKARVNVGRRPVVFVLTRKFIHFLRMHWII